MVNPFVSLAKGLTILGIVCLFLKPIPARASVEPPDIWKQSLDLLKSGKSQEACQSLKSWVAAQKLQHIESSEALFNLALCSWQSKETAASVTYALQGLKLRRTPFKRWTDLKLLRDLQKEIGMRDNLPSRESFILKMVFPNETVLVLALLGFWILIATLTFRKNLQSFYAFSIGAILFLESLAAILFVFQKSGGPIAVISSKDETPIVAFDKNGTPQELAILPSGSLLELGSIKNEFTQVIKPISGWIKTESLETVIP
jgi:hypothetical protein